MKAGSESACVGPQICVTCEYALDGLPSQGICPECGSRYSAHDDLILRGSSVMSILTGCTLLIAAVVILLITGMSASTRVVNPLTMLLPLTVGAALLVAGFVMIIGVPLTEKRGLRPQLVVSQQCIRFRRAGIDALRLRWTAVQDIKCKRLLGFGVHYLVFRVGSLAFRPRFFWRSDRQQAQRVLAALHRRMAGSRDTLAPRM